MTEPKFALSERVQTVVNRRVFVGEVRDRHCDEDGTWWYTIDGRNYLDESRWEHAA